MKLSRIYIMVVLLTISLNAKSLIDVNFSNLEINEFIKIVANISNKNILVTDSINGKVDLVSNKPIYDDELIEMLSSVLKSKKYALVENGSIYEVVKLEDAVNYSANYNSKKQSNSFIVSELIQVNHNDVDLMASKLETLISKHSKLVTIKSSNSILLSDYPKNIKVVKQVLKKIDVKLNNEIYLYSVKHVQSKLLASYIDDISKQLFNQDLKSDLVKVILHEDLNSIILVGKKSNLDTLKALMIKFDIYSSNSQTMKVFHLNNSKAEDVSKTINTIIKNHKLNDGALKPTVSFSEDINSVIVVGSSTFIGSLNSLINDLDAEKYQVYVEARIIQINKQNTEDLGVKYGFDGASLLSNGGLFSFSTNFGGISPTQGIVAPLINTNILDSGFALGASIDFLQTNGASESISNPSLLCVNNKESSIHVGKIISIASGSVSTSDSGITNSFTREDVGLTLKITPRISSFEKVTLDVSIVIEDIIDDGSNNPTGQPVTTKQEVLTQTILNHGENVIIGGLIKNYDLDSTSKVPLLGDIPFLGSLFTSTSTSRNNDNLVIILTPYILGSSDDLSRLQQDLGTLSTLQKKYNKEVFERLENEGFKDD